MFNAFFSKIKTQSFKSHKNYMYLAYRHEIKSGLLGPKYQILLQWDRHGSSRLASIKHRFQSACLIPSCWTSNHKWNILSQNRQFFLIPMQHITYHLKNHYKFRMVSPWHIIVDIFVVNVNCKFHPYLSQI